MAEEPTTIITLRRPVDELGEYRKSGSTAPQTGPLTIPQIINAAPEEIRSLKEGEQVNAYSFNDAVAAASIFYGLRAYTGITIQVDQAEELPPNTRNRAERRPQPTAHEPRQTPHPLTASALCTIRIMWFSIRHPGKAAWINHRTGEVWPAS